MNSSEPTFTRGEVAKILGVTTITIANREKSNKYPKPRRDLNNYRMYTLADILQLQLVTYSKIDGSPIIAILFDKGFKDAKMVSKLLDNAIEQKKKSGQGFVP
jgi:DNA-binding transcriptional MerR regulator